ncbi:helix-turn-helix transcriptional regulator [Afipia sp. GAS231]|uniref:helix-turn-helix transcriptional regulator n=1 Tax=Afipia sp. GAS231 TaxID=1882747 RepID=UPI000B830557|nr:helix-turn-helix domain-containing protein [Afipia sp. GAS231]
MTRSVTCRSTSSRAGLVGRRRADLSVAFHATSIMARAPARRGTRGRKGLSEPGDSSAGRLNFMKADVLRNLDKNDLTIESIARTNALSARQAQRLFASLGTTFSEFVLEQRLLLARRLLLHEQSRHRKVSDIAYTVGFNDLSYFHKSFRRRFGVTPADMRAELAREH